VSSTMPGSVEPRYSCCRLSRDYRPPGYSLTNGSISPILPIPISRTSMSYVSSKPMCRSNVLNEDSEKIRFHLGLLAHPLVAENEDLKGHGNVVDKEINHLLCNFVGLVGESAAYTHPTRSAAPLVSAKGITIVLPKPQSRCRRHLLSHTNRTKRQIRTLQILFIER
jgi:hypothetical protein